MKKCPSNFTTLLRKIKILRNCSDSLLKVKIMTVKKINKNKQTKRIIKRQFWINLMIGKESKHKWPHLLPNSITIKFNNKMFIKKLKAASLKILTRKINQQGKVQGTVLPWISTCPLLRSRVLQLLKILNSEKAQNNLCPKWLSRLQERILISKNKALKAPQNLIPMNKIQT